MNWREISDTVSLWTITEFGGGPVFEPIEDEDDEDGEDDGGEDDEGIYLALVHRDDQPWGWSIWTTSDEAGTWDDLGVAHPISPEGRAGGLDAAKREALWGYIAMLQGAVVKAQSALKAVDNG